MLTVSDGATVSLGFVLTSAATVSTDATGFFFIESGSSVVTSGILTLSDTGYQLGNDTNVSRLWTSGAKETFTSIVVKSGGVAIPEPSFFGLLAGTLALGLAGTRRRRRAGTQK